MTEKLIPNIEPIEAQEIDAADGAGAGASWWMIIGEGGVVGGTVGLIFVAAGGGELALTGEGVGAKIGLIMLAAGDGDGDRDLVAIGEEALLVLPLGCKTTMISLWPFSQLSAWPLMKKNGPDLLNLNNDSPSFRACNGFSL